MSRKQAFNLAHITAFYFPLKLDLTLYLVCKYLIGIDHYYVENKHLNVDVCAIL